MVNVEQILGRVLESIAKGAKREGLVLFLYFCLEVVYGLWRVVLLLSTDETRQILRARHAQYGSRMESGKPDVNRPGVAGLGILSTFFVQPLVRWFLDQIKRQLDRSRMAQPWEIKSNLIERRALSLQSKANETSAGGWTDEMSCGSACLGTDGPTGSNKVR